MRCLIIANERDYTAIAVAQLLRERHGRHAVQLRSVNEIVFAPHWEHELQNARTQSHVRFHDGVSVSDFCPSVVFNRMHAADVPVYVGTHPTDRDYGRLEWNALLLSWLHSLDIPVVNAPSAGSLSGRLLGIATWYQLASRARLRVLPLFATTSTREFPPPRDYVPSGEGAQGWYTVPSEQEWCTTDVIGAAMFDAPTPETGEACRRLAELAQVRILRTVLCRSSGSRDAWQFHSSTTSPDLRTTERILALAELLELEAGS